jgi:hypothetical protein
MPLPMVMVAREIAKYVESALANAKLSAAEPERAPQGGGA